MPDPNHETLVTVLLDRLTDRVADIAPRLDGLYYLISDSSELAIPEPEPEASELRKSLISWYNQEALPILKELVQEFAPFELKQLQLSLPKWLTLELVSKEDPLGIDCDMVVLYEGKPAWQGCDRDHRHAEGQAVEQLARFFPCYRLVYSRCPFPETGQVGRRAQVSFQLERQQVACAEELVDG